MVDEELEKNEIVSGQEVAQSKVDIVYFKPPFYTRVLANLIDVLIFIFLFAALLLGIRAIINSTPTYQSKSDELTEIRLNSGVYAYDDNNILRDIISELNYDKGQTAKSRYVKSRNAIETFLSYSSEVCTSEQNEEIVKDYNTFRLDENLKHENIPLFIKDGDNIIENPTLIDGAESVSSNIYGVYYQQAYARYIDEHVQAFLVKSIPHYGEIISYQTNILLWVQIFMNFCITGLIVYLMPTFIFRRGRMTFGKALYGIGLVDKECLCPKMGRFMARFSIFYFGELILSLFSFGLPFLLSFTLMAFSKNKQGFPDYMLHLYEVDTSKANIYMDYVEAQLKNELHGDAIDFQMDKPL